MNLIEAIQFFSAILGIFASIFFGHGIALQKTSLMLDMSCSYLGPNPSMISDLSEQKSDYLIGFSLLCISFILQILSLIIEEQLSELVAFNKYGFIIYSILLFPLIYIILKEISNNLSLIFKEQINTLWEEMQKNLETKGSYK